MARVAIVSYDVQTIRGKAGGVGAFTTRLANLLRAAGDSVTIVMTRTDWEPMSVDQQWRARYQANDISLIELQSPPPLPTRWPELATMRIAEIAAPVLMGFDIVYFQDWGNAAFHLVRERRYATGRGPVCVTVLHGPSEWELSSNEKYPELPGDLHLSYQERYAAEHSDFVVSPSQYLVNHLSGLGWKWPGAEVEVLGLPMPAPDAAVVVPAAGKIRTIVYFARVEKRKGIQLFVKALEVLVKDLREKPAVVLLGSANDAELLEAALRGLKAAGYAVSHVSSLDSDGALKYLRENAPHTLCVVPSPSDNHPYALVEASLVPGLDLIACRGGGIPEILGHAEAQLSEAHPRVLAAKILEHLQRPLTDAELVHYDWRGANERWLAFHAKALGAVRPARVLPAVKASVDVCVTYYQKASYLGQFVDALECQTDMGFHVIAVNDGSPDEESNRVFEEYAAKTAARGWDFFRQENAFVDAARNNAAKRGKGEYILFIDSDDVPARNAVERMRDAMTLSGDDALVCGSYLFASAKAPFDTATGETTVSSFAICVPLGINLVGGLLDPSSFGGSMFMMRRSVFEALGGLREVRGAGHEDWEFYVRTALAGYRIDIVPDLLQFYRQVDGSLARTLSEDSSKRRLLHPYEARMTEAGLQGGARALAGLYLRSKEQEEKIKILSAKVNAPRDGYAFFSGATKRFEVDDRGVGLGRLRTWYREVLSMETRLKIHEMFFARFFGPHDPKSK